MYTIDFFISKFEAIPEEKWTTGIYHSDTASCALGHCGMSEYGSLHIAPEARALVNIFNRPNTEALVPDINDGKNSKYSQPTPKQRILAALYDIKANQAVDQAQQIANTKTEPVCAS